jgi:hypothetical protein
MNNAIVILILARKEMPILFGKVTKCMVVVMKEVGDNYKPDKSLFGHSHEILQKATMEVGSRFIGEIRSTSLASDNKATNTRPRMEDKTPKNILENMFVGRRG